MKTATINLAFPVTLDSDGNGFSYVNDNRLSVSCYARNGAAVKQLKTALAKEIDEALNLAANTRGLIISTRAGETFVVRFSGCWWYHITGPGRGYAGSCGGNWPTLEACAADARKHAESSFGGVAWECSF